MKNSIDAAATFSFKGETYTPSMTVDLDALMKQHDSLPQFHHLLAVENGIDTYSYLFEVMEQSAVRFDNALGSVAEFVDNETLDIEAFQEYWRQGRVIDLLQSIAFRQMCVEDIETQPDLKAALLDAYNYGKTVV